MKIPKILTGLIVCGALVFPGALSSSAQEVDPSNLPESINYSTEQETEALTYNAVADTREFGKLFKGYQGGSVYHTEVIGQYPPYADHVYKGYIFYKSFDEHGYYYQGTLTLQK
ncbi:hypothetical protein [Lysinibacillus sp. G4S2]|uniref:hypothetical protein n=1 Tax=Lysinibacillus sp. G4S2 TaxID=3055859 RepID=UPI00259FE84F|nr:hypothetical protein [Lysinibacillus sp. G4S2]MDM5250314.1 hypothetical protein [Lysinibacillus sp. G4S2]